MSEDWDSGSPQKLKNVEISKLEDLFSEVVSNLVGGEGKITSDISSIDFRPHGSSGILHGTVEMKISFSKRIDTGFFEEESEK